MLIVRAAQCDLLQVPGTPARKNVVEWGPVELHTFALIKNPHRLVEPFVAYDVDAAWPIPT